MSELVEIKNDSPIGRKAQLSIGGQIIPFYNATIHIAADEMTTITATIPAGVIDVVALQEHTQLTVKHRHEPKRRKNARPVPQKPLR